MPELATNGITLHYDSIGNESDPAIVLVMGLGVQMILWHEEFCAMLAVRGFRVIRFDNRDIGLSSKFDRAGIPDMAAMMMAVMTGKKPDIAYSLADMAADAIGLLDALGIDRAHIVGASMGGMIAQVVAAIYPSRVLSLTSIMSTTGNPAVPSAQPEAMAVLTNRPTTTDTDTLVAFLVNAARVIGSPAYPSNKDRLITRVRSDLARSYSPTGYLRQMAAIMASGDRRPQLASITAPTLVIHGDADPLVSVEGGRDTAANIKGAELKIIPGMGHDLPLPLVDTIADAIAGNALRA